MTAGFINYNGETIALCLAPPDWGQPIKVALALPTDVERSITATESRRAYAQSARYSLEYVIYGAARTGTTDARASGDLKLWLARLKGETVAVPMWTDPVEISAPITVGATSIPKTADMPARYGAEWIILSADGSLFEIVVVNTIDAGHVTLVSGTSNSWPASTLMFPLLFGRLSERPQFESVTDELINGTIKFKENSPFSRRLNPAASTIPTVGSNIPSLSTMKLLAVMPNSDRPLTRDEVDTIYKTVGFTRQDAQEVFPQAVRRGKEFAYLFGSHADIAALEYFFVDRRATTRSFMTPTWDGDLRLTQDLPIAGNATRITIETSDYSDATRPTHPGDPYIALVGDDGAIDPHKIDVVAGTNLTTHVAVSVTHKYLRTIVSRLLMARFAEPTLTWTYASDGVAEARQKVIEIPDEYAAPKPDLPEPVDLFIFTETMKYPLVQRFTSYEQSWTVGSGPYAGTYTPASLSWLSMVKSLDPEQSKVTIKSGDFIGNPLKKFLPFTLEGALQVIVARADAANPTGLPKYLTSGEVKQPKADLTEAEAPRWGNLLKLKIPAHLLSAIDNWSLLHPSLGVNLSTFKVTGPIFAISGTQVDVTSATAFAKATDYFAEGGWVELGTNSATWELREIYHSEPLGPDKVRLILDRPLLKNAAGASVDMYPGYDGTIDQLETKFGVRANHGGEPFVPDTNPGVKGVHSKQSAGGKKL